MFDIAKLFEVLEGLSVTARMDALAMIGFLAFRGPTDEDVIRKAFAPFCDGHPQYFMLIRNALLGTGALASTVGAERLDETGSFTIRPMLIGLNQAALAQLLTAQGVPFIIGAEVYNVMPRPRRWSAAGVGQDSESLPSADESRTAS